MSMLTTTDLERQVKHWRDQAESQTVRANFAQYNQNLYRLERDVARADLELFKAKSELTYFIEKESIPKDLKPILEDAE